MKTTTHYEIEFQLKPGGYWHTLDMDSRRYETQELDLACMALKAEVAFDVRQKRKPNYRIVKVESSRTVVG